MIENISRVKGPSSHTKSRLNRDQKAISRQQIIETLEEGN